MPTSVLFFFMIVVGVPIIGAMSVGAFKHWLEHKEKMSQLIAAQTAEKAAQYAAQTERLEQRVQVLERIVTDKGLELSDETNGCAISR
ncbi:hypothetical protein TPR58_21350 [Sphingomonas sp. HF-S3]|uniref:Phage shock protein B n=1 Tax=Sphingomonas rustica TaxID=3103142 RepID=A0ABV0BE13_9SPHN